MPRRYIQLADPVYHVQPPRPTCGATPYTWKRWSYEFTTRALHVTLEQWIDWSIEAGFSIRALREPKPTEETVRAQPDLADATRVPYFLIFDLTGPAAGSAR